MARKNVTCENYMKLTQKEKAIMHHAIWLHLLLLVHEPEGGSASKNKKNASVPLSNQCFFRASPFSVTWEDTYLKFCIKLPINGYYYMFLVNQAALARNGHRASHKLWGILQRKGGKKAWKERRWGCLSLLLFFKQTLLPSFFLCYGGNTAKFGD